MDLLKNITEDDLPNDVMQHIAETCGIEVARALLLHCSGMRIEVPLKPKREAVKRYIIEHWDGENVETLVRQTGMSRSLVYKVLGEKAQARAPTSST